MNEKQLCDNIVQQISSIERMRQEREKELEMVRREAEGIRQQNAQQQTQEQIRIQNIHEQINVYLNQIPTNIQIKKVEGDAVYTDERQLSQMAIDASLAAEGMIQRVKYEQLYTAATGTQRYLLGLKKQSLSVEERSYESKLQEYNQKKQKISQAIDRQYRKLLQSEELNELTQRLASFQMDVAHFGMLPSAVYIGERYTNFPFPDQYSSDIIRMVGNRYDANRKKLRLPFSLSFENCTCLQLKHKSNRYVAEADMVSIMYSFMKCTPPRSVKFWHIDPLRYTGAGLGELIPLLVRKNSPFAPIPQNEKEIDALLSHLLERGNEIEKQLQAEGCDTFYQLNKKKSGDIKIPFAVLSLLEFPFEYTQNTLKMLRRIMVNAKRWGVFVIMTIDDDKLEGSIIDVDQIPFQVLNCPSNNFMARKTQALSQEVLEQLCPEPVMNHRITEYTYWVDLHKKPQYVRSVIEDGKELRCPIRVPIGIDEQDTLHFLEFEGMYFAGYLMGSAGSGKSTLLHSIIAGILYHYHPDDVELWLVDFKMSEFSTYLYHSAPHIKYIVMDYSPKVVCDLIDKVSQEMTRRAELFQRHPEWGGNISNVPPEANMPKIFLIIDEFEKMSKILTNTESGISVEDYKQKLADILARGRSMGFRILFSSQNYSEGVKCLSKDARNNIGLRIAMKNHNTAEMETVLNLPDSLKEEGKRKISNLQKYELLLTEKDAASGQMQLYQMRTLYFPEKKEIHHLTKNVRKFFHSELKTDFNVIRSYREKNPRFINGKMLQNFDTLTEYFQVLAEAERQDNYEEKDFPVFFGVQQSMTPIRPVWLTAENKQNMMLVAPKQFAVYAASIVFSIAKCFANSGGEVMVIGYERNAIYNRYKDTCWSMFAHTKSAVEANRYISQLVQKLRQRENAPVFLVLFGIKEIGEDIIAAEKEQEFFASNNENEVKPDKGVALTRTTEMGFQVRGLNFSSSNNKLTNRESKTNSDFWENLQYLLEYGPRQNIHVLSVVSSMGDIGAPNTAKALKDDYYAHMLSFKVPYNGENARLREVKRLGVGDDGRDESLCIYNGYEKFSFRPFLHPELTWGDWIIDEGGNAVKRIKE